ncbi:MAG: VTT domain-containing protein [Parcubacteria group bacterium]
MQPDFITLVQDMVLKPDLASAGVLFWFSLVNELTAILPYVVLVSGQLIFLEVTSFPIILAKFFLYIAVPAGIGGAVGSMLIYSLAYFGGKPTIEKYKKYLRFSWDDVEKITQRFKGAWYDELIFLAIRSVPILPSLPINIVAGTMRMRPLAYFIYTAIGFTIRMMILFLFMWFGAEALSLSLDENFLGIIGL